VCSVSCRRLCLLMLICHRLDPRPTSHRRAPPSSSRVCYDPKPTHRPSQGDPEVPRRCPPRTSPPTVPPVISPTSSSSPRAFYSSMRCSPSPLAAPVTFGPSPPPVPLHRAPHHGAPSAVSIRPSFHPKSFPCTTVLMRGWFPIFHEVEVGRLVEVSMMVKKALNGQS
jgi:hypothetical protein